MFRGAGAVLGFVAVAASIVLLTEDLPYPGILALAPTLGTAALVYGLDAGRLPAGIARLLVLPAMVVVGDMSYSLYLWHWPVAVFMEVLWPAAGIVATVGALAVTAVLAGMAYVFVERPIHRLKFPPFGARRIRRGLSSPESYSSTLNPAGAIGQASVGRGTSVGPFPADSVAKGLGRSVTVSLRRVPGFCLR